MKSLKVIIVLTALLFGSAVSATQEDKAEFYKMMEIKSIALLDHLITLRKGDCEGATLARQIRFEDGSLAYVEENEPFLHAIYLIKGVCYEQDYAKAANILQKTIAYPDRTHLYARAYARLLI